MARTDRGVVEGTVVGRTLAFKGIPYAAAPMRFRAPVAPACWNTVKNASTYGQRCVQLDPDGHPEGDEDCLTINVWTPVERTGAPLPILFFVHGGADISGSTQDTWLGEPAYDGQELSERAHAIVVTANYRLGLFGFLALPSLSAESESGTSGNYGLLDLIAALRWVQTNASAFGGDPSRVLLFGHSAGAHNTCALVASPLATGLFSRAMMMSERCSVSPRSVVEQDGATVVSALGCSGAADIPACLRAVPAASAVEAVPGSSGVGGAASNGYYFALNVDGYVLRDSPITALAAGTHNHVPFIIGSTAHETSTQIANLPTPISTEQDYVDLAHELYGTDLGDRALAKYPVSDYGSPFGAAVTMTTDQRFICQARRIARAIAGGQAESVRRYVFTYFTQHPQLAGYGAFHGIDVSFVFRTLRPFNQEPFPTDLAVSDRMIGYLAQFAETGDVNAWPEFSETAGGLAVIGADTQQRADFAGSWCDFWDSAIY